jgi:eukaryotic-like serine/threonine-protein kinase
MTNTSSWAAQYLLFTIIALFAGPALSNLPVTQSIHYRVFGLSSAHSIHLIVEAAGLAMLGLLAIRAFRQMPDNGRGFSFLRQLVLPSQGHPSRLVEKKRWRRSRKPTRSMQKKRAKNTNVQ